MDNQLMPSKNLAAFIQTVNAENAAQHIIDQIDNDKLDIKEVVLAAEIMFNFSAILKDRLKDGFHDAMNEFSDWKKEKVVEFLGMRIKNNGESASYTFDLCNDPYLSGLQSELADKELELTPIKKQIKERQDLLKRAKCSFADEYSGGETVYPAAKTTKFKQPTITRL
jgi:hypothetical protein